MRFPENYLQSPWLHPIASYLGHLFAERKKTPVTMNLWHVEEEWVIEKSAEADAAVDIITWAYTQSHFT